MRLISIDIENFGKLSDFHLKFDDNPMVIIQENGWGKSTLASFIRVMFFGFMDENKKKSTERERNIMRPWNHGVYGGAVNFEVNERQYRLERTFGTKPAEDISRLVDITTKITCNDYDTACIGEQIFGISSEAYIRTTFVGQNNLSIRNDKDGIDDSITAKIGNLTEATDDINNYEVVFEKLKATANSIKSGNKKGQINILLEQRDGITQKLNSEEVIETRIKALSVHLEQLAAELEQDRETMQKFDEEYAQAGRLEAVKVNYNNLKQMKRELDDCKEKLNALRRIFDKRIPNVEEVEEMTATINEAMALKERCHSMSKLVNRNEQKKSDIEIVPEKQEIERTIANYNKRLGCIEKLKDAENRYRHEKEILLIKNDMRNMELRHKKEERLKELEEYRQRKKSVTTITVCIISLLVAIAVIVAGVLFAVTKNLLSWTIVVAGVIISLIIVMCARQYLHKKNIMESPLADWIDDEDSYEQGELEKIKEIIQVHKDKVDQYNREISEFCGKYRYADDELLEGKLSIILGKISAEDKEADIWYEYNSACENLSLLSAKIKGWFEGICNSIVDDWFGTVLLYRKTLTDIEQVELQAKSLEDKIHSYEYYEEEYESLKDVRETADIIRCRNELDEKMDNIRKTTNSEQRELDELHGRFSELLEEKEKLGFIDEKLADYQHKYDIITRTMGYLNKAKEQLSARYMDPVGDAFAKYYSFITTEYLDAYEVDADMRITRQELGMGRDRNSLSKGYKDLVDIALRMALIEVMYDGEKPWIILDDPFVNLDSDKLDQVRVFIEEVSKEYQVLYFTCHESRA